MAEKEIHIFNTSNAVLQVIGIRFELFDVVTGALLCTDNSHDLNPGPGGTPSNDWGVRLKFSPSNHPLEVYTTDPNYRYPGNTIQSLEGKQTDRIDIDLHKVPGGPGGQESRLTSATPVAVSKWVHEAPKWNEDEKRAVLNLVFNYMRAISPQLAKLPKSALMGVAENWEKAMSQLGIQPDDLKK